MFPYDPPNLLPLFAMSFPDFFISQLWFSLPDLLYVEIAESL